MCACLNRIKGMPTIGLREEDGWMCTGETETARPSMADLERFEKDFPNIRPATKRKHVILVLGIIFLNQKEGILLTYTIVTMSEKDPIRL